MTDSPKRAKAREAERRYEAANRDKINAKQRKYLLKSKYGITPEQFDSMLSAQDFRCAICKNPDPGGRHNSWNVDHCHTSGRVRGLLCTKCNRGLGLFSDNQTSLLSAVDYLKAAS